VRAFVTGSGGFIGRHLVGHLEVMGWQVIAPGRTEVDLATLPVVDLAARMASVDVVFHLAGRAHRGGRDDAVHHERDNVRATERAFEAAVAARAQRFVFMSSARVLGERSTRPLTESDPVRPAGPYAESKARAERLLAAQRDRGIAISVVRAPLVYGAGVGANFLRLLDAIGRGLPLPIGAAMAPRSQIAVRNLVDLLVRCTVHGGTFAVLHGRDDVDYSTYDLALALAAQMKRPLRAPAVPPSIVIGAATLLGRGAMARRLFEPAQLDDTSTRALLDWQPPQSSADALLETVRWWRQR